MFLPLQAVGSPSSRPRRGWVRSLLLLPVLGWIGACQGQGDGGGAVTLGPADGFDLPPTDLERVAVGDAAPLFTLESYHGEPVSLEDYRGEKNVVLVFYRGHW